MKTDEERRQAQRTEMYRKTARENRKKRYHNDLEFRERIKLIIRKSRKKRHYENRNEIIKLLGNKCIECGFSDVRALQIDHVRGNGSKERNQFRKKSPYAYYRDILREIKDSSKDYQLLCANCNWIKKIEKREI